MRYLNADDITFTAPDGRVVQIKEALPLVPPSASSVLVECDSEVSLDEIATRPEIYGDEREASAYLIFDENIVKIFEANFEMGRIKTLRVPM